MSASVILVGGSPGAGKTTLGHAVAERLGWASLTIDDLRTALLGATSPADHPDLHIVGRPNAVEYFTNTAPPQMVTDAVAQHTALWPAIVAVIQRRTMSEQPVVIDGWHLMPTLVAGDRLSSAHACWLDVDHDVLAAREQVVSDFYATSPDPERMFNNFVARSVIWNDRMAREARELGMQIMHQDGTRSVESLADEVLIGAGLDSGDLSSSLTD